MFKIRYAPLLAFIMTCLLVTPLQASLLSKPDGAVIPQPRVDLYPEDVVRIVINALANNDQPYANAGIETTFAFASPANKVNTGPLEKFTRMVKGPPYGMMVDHVNSEFSEIVLADNKAYQMVHLTARDGRAVVFAFRLSRQLDGEFKDMWMTDAVWPVSNAVMPQKGF